MKEDIRADSEVEGVKKMEKEFEEKTNEKLNNGAR